MTFVEYGPYLEPPADRTPALDGDLDADVAIVGGGYAGLSTALVRFADAAVEHTEPLRWLAFQAINGALGAFDARTDRQLRRRRAS
jgi:hypothetical protein